MRRHHPQEYSMKQTMSKSKSKKGREEKKKRKKNSKNPRKEAARKGNTHTLGSQAARGGGVAPRRKNRITESDAEESRKAID